MLKFRVYDTKKQTYHLEDAFLLQPNGLMERRYSGELFDPLERESRYIVERNSGIRDRYETPIHEGDILELVLDSSVIEARYVVRFGEYLIDTGYRYIHNVGFYVVGVNYTVEAKIVNGLDVGKGLHLTTCGSNNAPDLESFWEVKGNIHDDAKLINIKETP